LEISRTTASSGQCTTTSGARLRHKQQEKENVNNVTNKIIYFKFSNTKVPDELEKNTNIIVEDQNAVKANEKESQI